MMPHESTLHTVPPLPGKSTFEYRFEVAALVTGRREVHVQALRALSGAAGSD
jgi:hypothetical protein